MSERLQILRKSDKTLVGQPFLAGKWIPHPDKPLGKLGGPAAAGWENDEFKVVAVEPAPAPKEGMRRAGSIERVYDEATGTSKESFAEEPVPAPVELTDAQRLEAATGLTAAQIKAVLGIAVVQKL